MKRRRFIPAMLTISFLFLFSQVLVALPDQLTPEPVMKNIGYTRNAFGRTLISEVEYRAVMNAGFNDVVKILSNPEGVSELFKNIAESRVVNHDPANLQRKIKAVYRVLGHDVSYSYIENLNIPENNYNSFKIESRLQKSLDESLNDYRGYWKVERIPGDPARSEVTLYSYYNYRNPFFLQDVILDTFTDNEIKDMYNSVEKAASRK